MLFGLVGKPSVGNGDFFSERNPTLAKKMENKKCY